MINENAMAVRQGEGFVPAYRDGFGHVCVVGAVPFSTEEEARIVASDHLYDRDRPARREAKRVETRERRQERLRLREERAKTPKRPVYTMTPVAFPSGTEYQPAGMWPNGRIQVLSAMTFDTAEEAKARASALISEHEDRRVARWSEEIRETFGVFTAVAIFVPGTYFLFASAAANEAGRDLAEGTALKALALFGAFFVFGCLKTFQAWKPVGPDRIA